MKSKSIALIIISIIVTILGFLNGIALSHEGHDPQIIIYQGEIFTTQVGYDKNMNISGGVQMIRRDNGTTTVFVYLEGLAANTTYPAHIHTLACTLGGGGHYKIDYDIAEALAENEIWPTVITDSNGIGIGIVTVNHIAGRDANSLIIHDPVDGGKIACANILPISAN